MRIRSTKPEFWKSRRIASVDWDARLVLKGLESYVDDNGVGVDDIELIVTDVFPRDMFANPRETVARVSEAIRSLHRAGLVHRYEANGDHLLYISFWEEVQRIDKPGKGRNPRPDGTFDYKESEIRESVASPPETLAPGTGEQGNRGTGEQGNSARSARGARKAPAKRLPEDWAPTDAHRKKAAELGVDLELEVDRFRLHAEANDRRAVRWDAAFSMWLSKATPPLPGMGARGNANDRRVQDTAALLNRAPWEGATLTTDDWRAERERTAHGHPNHPTLDTQGALEA